VKVFLVIVWMSNFGQPGVQDDIRGPFASFQLCQDAMMKARKEMPLRFFEREIGLTCVSVTPFRKIV
jgi:hypothetical protein